MVAPWGPVQSGGAGVRSELLTQLVRFATSGVANTALGLIAIYLAMAAGLQYVTANAVGYAVGLACSYLLNRNWTFEQKGRAFHKDILPFLVLAVAAYAANLVAVVFSVEFLGVSPALAQLVGVALYAALNFIGMKYFVFPPDRNIDT